MNISNITPPQVWTSSSRSLTNFGSGALTSASAVQTTIAASGTVDLRTSAGIVGQITINLSTGSGATSTVSIKMLDGPHNPNIAASASGSLQTVSFSMVDTSATGPQLVNSDGAVAATYITSAYLMTI